jgi:hypothetical protein
VPHQLPGRHDRRRVPDWHFLVEHGVEIEMGPGRYPQSTAIFIYFLGPESFTYEYRSGVRRIEDDATWRPRTFDPAAPGSIDMWLGPTSRPTTQPQVRDDVQQAAEASAALPAPLRLAPRARPGLGPQGSSKPSRAPGSGG